MDSSQLHWISFNYSEGLHFWIRTFLVFWGSAHCSMLLFLSCAVLANSPVAMFVPSWMKLYVLQSGFEVRWPWTVMQDELNSYIHHESKPRLLPSLPCPYPHPSSTHTCGSVFRSNSQYCCKLATKLWNCCNCSPTFVNWYDSLPHRSRPTLFHNNHSSRHPPLLPPHNPSHSMQK